MSTMHESTRLPSEKKIRRRRLAIFELDTIDSPNAVKKLNPEEKEEFFRFMTELTRDHDVTIYTENRETLLNSLPQELTEYVIEAPPSWESYSSRTAFENKFYERALRGREYREAILFANKSEFIGRARRAGIISVYMPWGVHSLTGSATYGISEVYHLKEFVGRKL